MDYGQGFGVGIGVGITIAFLLVLRLLWNRLRSPSQMQDEPVVTIVEIEEPRCVCGELARFPAPQLKRNRGAWDWLRNYFAAPPRYAREVDTSQPPVFCRAHVHVADAFVDQFIFRVRQEYSTANAKVAAEAANFEQESLIKLVAESLTDTQKRAVKRTPSLLRVLPAKTGTEDTGDGN